MRVRRVELGASPASIDGTGVGGHERIAGLGLEIAEAGMGGRPLLVVHGFTGAKEDFCRFLDPLAERGWHAVAADLRGHGGSDHPAGPGSYSFELLAGDLTALGDALNWANFTVLGHSMGGALAQRLALDRPCRLCGLVLISTFHGPLRAVDPALVELGASIVSQFGMEGLADALAAHRASQAAPGGADPTSPRDAEWARAKLEATSAELWLALAPRFLDDADRLDALLRLDLPTEVIVGDRDETMLDDCRRLAASIPGAHLSVIAGAGHSPQLDDPEGWWAALCSFLDGLALELDARAVASPSSMAS